jgi:hypothetical protein
MDIKSVNSKHGDAESQTESSDTELGVWPVTKLNEIIIIIDVEQLKKDGPHLCTVQNGKNRPLPQHKHRFVSTSHHRI